MNPVKAGMPDTLTLKIIAPVSVINAKAKRKIIKYDHVMTFLRLTLRLSMSLLVSLTF